MIAILQRVAQSSVEVDGREIAAIGKGLLVLLGITHRDTREDAEYLAHKILELRIFNDANGKMNISVEEIKGELLVVSQFTLLGDCRKGRRPSYDKAAPPDTAKELYGYFVEYLGKIYPRVEAGIFGAMMNVSLINDGPVTLIVKSKNHET